MKHKGDRMELADDRGIELMKCHDKYIEECGFIKMSDLYSTIVEWPCRRFWVSPRRAFVVVSKIANGESIADMLPLKREMYLEIYSRVQELAMKNPDCNTYDLCCMAVRQPAPKFYLTSGSAKIMISKMKRKWTEIKRRRLGLNTIKEDGHDR